MKKHGIPMNHIARQVLYWNLKVHTCVLCCSGSLTVALFLTGTWAGHQIRELCAASEIMALTQPIKHDR